jgi:GWxTD domain-containing protein
VRVWPAYILLAAALLFGPHAGAYAQPPPESAFSLEAHAFLDAERRPAVLVTVEIPYSNLIFLRRGGVFQSDYAAFIKVLDRRKRILESAVATESVVSRDYEATRSARTRAKLTRRFLLPQGEYTVECVIEVKNTQRVFRKETTVAVPEFLDTGVSVGAPRLYAVEVDTARSAPLLPEAKDAGGRDAEGLESTFFAALDKHPLVKFDVYAQEETGDSLDCDLYFEVVDEKKEAHAYGRSRARIAGVANRFSVYLDVDEWDPGAYVFSAKAIQRDRARETSSSLKFVLAYTKTMLTRHFERTLALLSLIASPDEIAELKDAGGAERPPLWASFWARRDPTPETEVNEALEEHLRRVRYAVDNFSDASAGWESDRGKVYIKYGEPDHTELKIDPQHQGEYLIWYYYRENRRFVFYDRFGLGEYRLTGAGQL